MHFREATVEDIGAIVRLYKRVAAIEGGIARLAHEITDAYVEQFVAKSSERGLIIVCEHPTNKGEFIAELHGYRGDLKVFNHVLGDVTLVVDPDHQRKKIGKTILTIFLNEIAQYHPEVAKVELITRESNLGAIRLYQSMGFMVEGRLEMRVKTTAGLYEADIPMGWQNPNYEF
jgi:ribosomal protein S18 acetylase RimI-like enzyme